MTEKSPSAGSKNRYLADPRFSGILPFQNKVWLSSPTMHGEEQKWINEAFSTNWVSTVGENINEIERMTAELIGRRHAVALASGTAALHLAIRLCGEKLYGRPMSGQGTLAGRRVFCSDMTFSATVNPVAYEGGEAVFIDSEYDTWNMDPAALERAFALYPEVRLVVVAHLYGTPAKIDEIVSIARAHDALVVEDAAESFCATYKGLQTGSFGDVSICSWNGNKLITGSSGGMLLTDDPDDAAKIRKWSTQSREPAPWYQHEDMGYNYRMSNIIAGVVRGQLPHAGEHLAQKKAVYERYKAAFADLPVTMNPFDGSTSCPNYWLSCLLLDRDALCQTSRGALEAVYTPESGKSCPTEILEALAAFNAEGRPIWKPMHMQPIYRSHLFVTADGQSRTCFSDDPDPADRSDIGADIFRRGLCLPSDNKMTAAQQDVVIEIIRRCFE
ncbi:MAG: DegT/DnrJ/EryC1/StrS family aminotransferase [Oscillospiraceae bacterium]|nr:DegT/DnrJ/EryC1/StrS family aminotransferase [Oscillospiraceae bacterium]